MENRSDKKSKGEKRKDKKLKKNKKFKKDKNIDRNKKKYKKTTETFEERALGLYELYEQNLRNVPLIPLSVNQQLPEPPPQTQICSELYSHSNGIVKPPGNKSKNIRKALNLSIPDHKAFRGNLRDLIKAGMLNLNLTWKNQDAKQILRLINKFKVKNPTFPKTVNDWAVKEMARGIINNKREYHSKKRKVEHESEPLEQQSKIGIRQDQREIGRKQEIIIVSESEESEDPVEDREFEGEGQDPRESREEGQDPREDRESKSEDQDSHEGREFEGEGQDPCGEESDGGESCTETTLLHKGPHFSLVMKHSKSDLLHLPQCESDNDNVYDSKVDKRKSNRLAVKKQIIYKE